MALDQLNRAALHTQDIMGVLLYHELARVQRYSIPLSLIRLAVEYPNRSNADNVTGAKKIINHVLNANLRAVDAAGYFESDYLVLLAVTDEPGALVAAKRLSKLLYAQHPLPNGQKLEMTTFMGITTLPERTRAPLRVDDFIARATKALSKAKKSAPGSVVAYSQLGKTTAHLG